MTGDYAASVMRLHHAGQWPKSISTTLGISRSRVYRVLAAAGVKPNPSPAQRAYVDRDEVAAMLRAGKRHQDIADWFGISQQRVAQIAARLGVVRKPRKMRSCAAPSL